VGSDLRRGGKRKLAAASVAVALTALAAVGSPAPGLAQDATPIAGGVPGVVPIPNHIHAGTCDTLSPEPLVPLADARFPTEMAGGAATPATGGLATPVAGTDATPVAGAGGMGATAAVPVAVGSTQIDLALTDILAAEHAINFHDPAAPTDPSRYLACGEIGGTPDEQGNLFVGLKEQNESGWSGVAWLLDDGSGTGTTVTVFLADNDATVGGMMGGMGMATPAP